MNARKTLTLEVDAELRQHLLEIAEAMKARNPEFRKSQGTVARMLMREAIPMMRKRLGMKRRVSKQKS